MSESDEEFMFMSEDEKFVTKYFEILRTCIKNDIFGSKIKPISIQIKTILGITDDDLTDDLDLSYGSHDFEFLITSFNSKSKKFKPLLENTYSLIAHILLTIYFNILQKCELVFAESISRQIEILLNLHQPLHEVIRALTYEEEQASALYTDEKSSTKSSENSTLYIALNSNEEFRTLLTDSFSFIIKEYNSIEFYKKYSSEIIILQPSPKYVPIATFNFNSVREENSFNRNFVEMEHNNPSSSMFLALNVHGEFVPNSQPHTIDGLILNKFSVSAPGQCALMSIHQQMYIFYSMCNAVKTHTIVDVPTILKEGNAHAIISLNITNPTIIKKGPFQIFLESPSNKDEMYKYEIQDRPTTTTAYHSGKVGETNTKGDSFFIKLYSMGSNEKIPLGIYLCKDWPEIGGVEMDNLIINEKFIQFITSRYPEHRMLETRFGHKQLYKQIDPDNPFKPDIVFGGVKQFTSLDLFEFCKFYGRPHISLVDNSCSVFPSNENSITRYDELNNPIYDNHAKGTRKGTRKGNRNKKHKKKTIKRKPKRKQQKYRRYI